MEWNTLEGEILQVSWIFANRVSFRILVKESKGNVMYILLGGAKLYFIPESKAYDKLGEPGIMLHCVKHNQHA